MKNIIKWEWWEHPLGGGVEFTDEAVRPKPDDDVDLFDEDEYDRPNLHLVRPVVPTPAGMMPVNVYGSLTKAFNFWMAHTNFDLTPEVRDAVKLIPGVESVDILTRYRMRIGFAMVFDAKEVKYAIQEACGANQHKELPSKISMDEDTKQKITLLQKQASHQYKYWLIYLLPNGEITFSHSEEDNAYKQQLDVYREAQKLAGGLIFTHEDK